MVELMKACPTPWCVDGKPQHVNGTLKYDNRIRCTSCGVQSLSAASRDEAITAWNQRAHPTGEVGDIVAHPRDRYRKDMREAEIEALARAMCDFPDIRAPVQKFPGGIPWEMHMWAYEAYAKKWSPQVALIDLYGRGCRGGFGTGELDDFIPGWRDELSERTRLLAEIATLQSRLSISEGNAERVATGLYEHHWKGATVSGSWEQEQDCIKDKYRASARAAIASLGRVG